MTQFHKDLIIVLAVTAGVIGVIIGATSLGKSKKADYSDHNAPISEKIEPTDEIEIEQVEVLTADDNCYEDYSKSTAADEVRTVDDLDPGLKDYSEWVCNTRLTDADINGMSKKELRILRNTIYARHGYIFKSADLREHFSKFDWYVPSKSVVTDLSNIEQLNVALIQQYE